MRPSLIPLIATATAGAAAWRWDLLPNAAEKEAMLALASAAASLGASLLGFMLAALAILASINHVHLVQMMRKTGHYGDLLETLFAGCACTLACAALGFAMLFGLQPVKLVLCLLVAVHIGALTSLLDVGRKLWLVLSHLK